MLSANGPGALCRIEIRPYAGDRDSGSTGGLERWPTFDELGRPGPRRVLCVPADEDLFTRAFPQLSDYLRRMMVIAKLLYRTLVSGAA